MKYLNIKRLFQACLLLSFLMVTPAQGGEKKGEPYSPTALAVDQADTYLFVAEKTANKVDMVTLSDGRVVRSFKTNLPPTGVVVHNTKLYVTCTYATGEVLVFDVQSGELLQTIATGNGAISPMLGPKEERLYVANQYHNSVSIINLEEGKEEAQLPVKRQPMAMDISPNGRYLFVANLLPAMRADLDTVACEVTVLDLKKQKVARHIQLANGSNALRGLKVSHDGEYVFVSHNLGRFQVPTTQLEQGWMNTSALSIIKVKDLSYQGTALLDDPEYGAAGSWGIVCSPEYVYVAHSGTHDVSRIDYKGLIERVQQASDKERLSYDLSFLHNIRERYSIKGNGPRALALKGDDLLVAAYFSDTINMFSFDSEGEPAVKYIGLNPDLKIDSVRLGEIFFHDARHCFQGWQSCTGCHPNDARTDGLNWDLLNDGMGNPKNCKSMLLSHKTPPAMISGIRPSGEVAVRAGFQYIQFASVSESDSRAVDYYLQSLEPVASPFLVNGGLSEKAQKGEAVFNKVGCAWCHPKPYYTDLKTHEMGTPGPYDQQNTWDTPTLIEVWRTGPYLHDGRCATLREVFKREQHGLQQPLSEEDLEALVEYVNSL